MHMCAYGCIWVHICMWLGMILMEEVHACTGVHVGAHLCLHVSACVCMCTRVQCDELSCREWRCMCHALCMCTVCMCTCVHM